MYVCVYVHMCVCGILNVSVDVNEVPPYHLDGTSCTSEQYCCNNQCFPYTTYCDGNVDCMEGEVARDEDPTICSGIHVSLANKNAL